MVIIRMVSLSYAIGKQLLFSDLFPEYPAQNKHVGHSLEKSAGPDQESDEISYSLS